MAWLLVPAGKTKARVERTTVFMVKGPSAQRLNELSHRACLSLPGWEAAASRQHTR